MKILRVLLSILSLALLIAGAFFYSRLPEVASVRTVAKSDKIVISDFHFRDRLPVNMVGDLSPHNENKLLRSFLNLHSRALDCSVCHLYAKKALVRRMDDGTISLARLYGKKWIPIIEGDEGVKEMKRPPRCTECHKRGSSIMRRLYEGPRLRVLEDLSIIRYLGGR